MAALAATPLFGELSRPLLTALAGAAVWADVHPRLARIRIALELAGTLPLPVVP